MRPGELGARCPAAFGYSFLPAGRVHFTLVMMGETVTQVIHASEVRAAPCWVMSRALCCILSRHAPRTFSPMTLAAALSAPALSRPAACWCAASSQTWSAAQQSSAKQQVSPVLMVLMLWQLASLGLKASAAAGLACTQAAVCITRASRRTGSTGDSAASSPAAALNDRVWAHGS